MGVTALLDPELLKKIAGQVRPLLGAPKPVQPAQPVLGASMATPLPIDATRAGATRLLGSVQPAPQPGESPKLGSGRVPAASPDTQQMGGPRQSGVNLLADAQRAEERPVLGAGGGNGAPRLLGAGGQTATLADRTHEWTSNEPDWKTFDPGKPSIPRRLLGAAIGAAGGYAGGARLGSELGSEAINGPRTRAESDYERARQAWAGQGEGLQREQGADTAAAAQARDAAEAAEASKRTRLLGAPKPAEVSRDFVDNQGNEVAVMSDGTTKVLGKARPEASKPLSSPFEAYTYGSASEKSAAKEFLAIENKQKHLDRPPSEIEQRYQLFQSDPDAYKEMFGDRGSSQDQAQAARMLKYFDSQRKEIQNDFTIDDQTKQQHLSEIDDLEKPYLDTAQTQNGASSRSASSSGRGAEGPRSGEVEVITPHGEHGYIPKTNLAKALKRGYKQVLAQ